MHVDPNHLEKKYQLTGEKLQITMSFYRPLSLKANEFFLKEGEVSKQLAVVTKGLLRSYIYDDNANEITQQFYQEGSLLISFESFNNQIPAKENIKAITDTNLMVISYDDQNKLYELLPVWRQICKDFSDVNNHEMIERTKQFQIMSATERYRNFCKENPQILQQATLGHIASYIGVDIATLSRIRKKK